MSCLFGVGVAFTQVDVEAVLALDKLETLFWIMRNEVLAESYL